jgi:ClpP class serine protease
MTSNYWMIHPSLENELRERLSHTLSAEQLAAVKPRASTELEIVDGVASIPVRGFLTTERSRMLDYFGVEQTAYSEIQAQVREADANSKVRKIEFSVDSGGGIAGNALIDAADSVFAARKPTTAVVGDMAASAAYWIASQADEIVLTGPATMVGSIGVAVDMRVFENDVSIASTDAPRKRPDVTTEQGRADVRRELDDLHELFVAAITRGRGVTADKVAKDFGQGGVLLAEAAVRAGMADRAIRSSAQPSRRGTVAAMDLETLKADHPELYAQCVAAGVAKERSRVKAHLTLAEESKEFAVALAHAAEGVSVLDEQVQAAHLAANMRASRQAARVESSAPELGPAPAPAPNAGSDEAARIAATLKLAGLKGSN